jgi:toxin YhaV
VSPIIRNGWTIYYHPLFAEKMESLFNQVIRLKEGLSESDFNSHTTAKLFKALIVGIEEKIPNDPVAYYFALRKPLNKYCRLKKMGLPNRYRLFFKVAKEKRIIVILWLGFPRNEGVMNDCYKIFTRKVLRGEFPENIDDLVAECE